MEIANQLATPIILDTIESYRYGGKDMGSSPDQGLIDSWLIDHGW